MKQRQKAIIVMAEPGRTHGLDDLNIQLGRGWRVVSVTSMGGASISDGKSPSSLCFAALVVLEFAGDLSAEFLEQVQQAEELPEETGDGSHLDIGDSDV